MSNDKPLETNDEVVEEQDDDLFEDDESGQEDVAGEQLSSLSLEELNDLSGRKFDSKDDFFKHYKNLNSLVGDQQRVKTEKEKEKLAKVKDKLSSQNSELADKLASLEAKFEERDFLAENPAAKQSLELVKDVAKAKEIPLSEAWEKHLKDIVENANARESELEIGIKSKNRLNQSQAKALNSLAKRAREGQANESDIASLIEKWPGAI